MKYCFRHFAVFPLALTLSGPALAFEIVDPSKLGSQSFLLGTGTPATATVKSQPSFRMMPYAAIGGEAAWNRNIWLEGLRLRETDASSINLGTTSHVERRFAPAKNPNDRFTDVFAVPQLGAFVNYRSGGAEIGRLAITTGITGSASRGFDIAATRSFGLSDGVSLNFGPTLSFGEAERFGFQPQSWTGSRLGAAGATLGLQAAVTERVTASLSASYSVIYNQHPAAWSVTGSWLASGSWSASGFWPITCFSSVTNATNVSRSDGT
jgi:hypothetical protein